MDTTYYQGHPVRYTHIDDVPYVVLNDLFPIYGHRRPDDQSPLTIARISAVPPLPLELAVRSEDALRTSVDFMTEIYEEEFWNYEQCLAETLAVLDRVLAGFAAQEHEESLKLLKGLYGHLESEWATHDF